MPKFEVMVYNEEVRNLVKQGESHRDLSDDWGDTHYIEVSAEDLPSARSKALLKYPKEGGYVVEGVTQVNVD